MISRNPSITAIKFRIELFGKISLRDFVAIVFLCFAVCSECAAVHQVRNSMVVPTYILYVQCVSNAVSYTKWKRNDRTTYIPSNLHLTTKRDREDNFISVAFETLNWQPSRSFACWNVFKILSVVFFSSREKWFFKVFFIDIIQLVSIDFELF